MSVHCFTSIGAVFPCGSCQLGWRGHQMYISHGAPLHLDGRCPARTGLTHAHLTEVLLGPYTFSQSAVSVYCVRFQERASAVPARVDVVGEGEFFNAIKCNIGLTRFFNKLVSHGPIVGISWVGHGEGIF